MPSRFHTVDRQTPLLFPPSVQEWLPEEHFARFVVDIVDQLDLTSITSQYRGVGKRAYHPAMMLSLLIYGYANGIFSSRRLEKASYDSVAIRYITADRHPDHDTIALFRRRFLTEFKELFIQVLMVARQLDLISLSQISLDGTKIKANASKHKSMSWGKANQLKEQLEQEVEALLDHAERVDAEEEQADVDIPEELKHRETRLKRIKQAIEEIERQHEEKEEAARKDYEDRLTKYRDGEKARGRRHGGKPPQPPQPQPPEDKEQANLTDPESRVMLSQDGFIVGYNAQASVDIEHWLIVENHLSQQANDYHEMVPAVQGIQGLPEGVGVLADILADSGYYTRANIAACEQAQISSYIAKGRQSHHPPLTLHPSDADDLPDNPSATDRLHARMATPEGKALYAKRKMTVETVFGIIKQVMGFRHFQLRGVEKATGEWNLVSMAWNLKRLHALTV